MTSPTSSMPRIGVLGGMGPLASAEFIVKLVHATPARCDQDHFPVTLDSSPQIPDRPNALYRGGPDPMPAMVRVLRGLEAAGCALVAMPCNTVHYWYDRLAVETRLPIVHIADAVAAQIRRRSPQARRVAVLGSTVTSELAIYSKRLGNEWKWLYATRDELDELVLPGIAAVKSGDLPRGRALFLDALQRLVARGPDVIVLACTEIPLVISQVDMSIPVIDSTAALARHTVAAARALRAGNQALLPGRHASAHDRNPQVHEQVVSIAPDSPLNEGEGR
jgi:aspartate racemase